MRVLFQLGHPAHYHLFKNTIADLQRDGHQTYILIRKKDILEELLQQSGMPYTNILPSGKKSAYTLLLRLWRVFWFTLTHRVDVLVGSTPEVAQVGWLLHRRSVIMAEDDASIVPQFIKAVRPFVDRYLSPVSCNNGPLEGKTTHYEGFHKLAYLHPNRFTPSKETAAKYVDVSRPYFLLRFAKLNAYHDIGNHAHGISNSVARQLIDQLLPHGNVYITSERELPPEIAQYRLTINPLDIHHVMAFATLYIGDSQSMAVEAAMLGTPSLRFNDFAGRIGVLEELEHKYMLTFGINSAHPEELYAKIDELLSTDHLRELFQQRRQRMLADKIDVADFITQQIEQFAHQN